MWALEAESKGEFGAEFIVIQSNLSDLHAHFVKQLKFRTNRPFII